MYLVQMFLHMADTYCVHKSMWQGVAHPIPDLEFPRKLVLGPSTNVKDKKNMQLTSNRQTRVVHGIILIQWFQSRWHRPQDVL